MTQQNDDNGPVGLLILAAGESKRMGQPKQLLPYKNTTLLQHAINAALGTKCSPVVLVLGAHYELIYSGIAHNPVHIVENKDWKEGMASSIRNGMVQLLKSDPSVSSVVVMLCDQPFVTSEQIVKIIEASHITHKTIVMSEYEHAQGVPALFKKEHFEELMHLQGKEGAKTIWKAHKDHVYKVPFPQGIIDIDTAEDYNKVTGQDLLKG